MPVAPPVGDTVAVNVTVCPVTEIDGDEVTTVVVLPVSVVAAVHAWPPDAGGLERVGAHGALDVQFPNWPIPRPRSPSCTGAAEGGWRLEIDSVMLSPLLAAPV